MSSKAPASQDNSQSSSEKFAWVMLSIIFLLLAVAWLIAPATREEAFSDSLRWPEGFSKLFTPGGPTWWNPCYLMGLPMTTFYFSPVAMGCLWLGTTLLGPLLSPLVAFRIVVICFAIGGGFAMASFMRRISDSRWAVFVGTALYLMIPLIMVRGVVYEHSIMVMCFVFTPLLFRGIIAVSEDRTPAEIVLLGIAAAGLTLSYFKVSIILLPVLILWSWFVLKRQEGHRLDAFKALLIALGVSFICGLVPVLSGVVDFSNAAGLLFDPIEGWKHHYSFKTALSLWDPSGLLYRGAGQDVESDAAFFHIGAVPLLFLSFGLALPQLAEWRKTRSGLWFLILNASWLISIWFAAGPAGILGGHLDVLRQSQQISDASIPLLWLSFAWLGWVAWLTAIQLFNKRLVPALISTALFLLLPIFHVTEFIMPLFRDIRAPESFFSTSGLCFIAGAAALAAVEIFTVCISTNYRKILAVVAGIIVAGQLFSMFGILTSRFLPNDLFKEYAATCQFLKTAPLQGRVHALSGRYFTITLPQLAGRSLDTESAARVMQMKWIRHLEVAGNASADAQRAYLNLAGVAYILLDKEDPFSPKQMQDFYRSIYPVAFENRSFAVLENQNTLYPAFLAHDFVVLPTGSYALAPAALQLLPQNIVTVEQAAVNQSMPGFAGMANGTNQIALLPSFQARAGEPLVRIPLVGNRTDDYQRMSYQVSPSASGWLVVSEAYHPDWTVSVDGHPAETTRAEAALLGTYVPAGSHEVVFQFKAPAWYSLCLAIGALSWLVALAALLYLPSKWAPEQWRKWWTGEKAQG